MDATKIAVCHNRHIPRHRVFKDMTARGKLLKNLFSKVIADRGYISQTLLERLLSQMGIR